MAGDLAVVVTAASEFEAEAKAEVIRARGIEATVTRNAPSWTGHASISPTAFGASVLVHREDLERARALLERNGRLSLRALRRQFGLDDGALGELVEELVDVQQVAALEGKVLSWLAPAPREARAGDAEALGGRRTCQ